MNGLNALPIIGWIFAAVICFFVAVPLFFLWNWLAPTYFYWLPKVYLDLPFWHVVGLVWLIASVKGILLPHFGVSVTNKHRD